jgi:ribulose-5-phosphate 4-epimerase/fuculose-1-phosphate aldolase
MFQNRTAEHTSCFLHTHTLATSTIGSLKTGLLPLSQPGIMLANDVAHSHFDFFQPGDETVALMAGKRAMLQKWHGAFVSGSSLGHCFYIMLSLDRACEAQRALLATGAPFHVPTDAEVQKWTRAYIDDPFYGGYDGERVWPSMVRKAERLQPDFAK